MLTDQPPVHAAPATLTLFADASFCATTRVAGWGAWFKGTNQGPGRSLGGIIPGEVTHNSETETLAIALALHRLHKLGHLPRERLMVQSDSMHALKVLRQTIPGAVVSPHPDSAPMLDSRHVRMTGREQAIGHFLVPVLKGCVLVVRHVRGHNPGVNGRNYVNQLCDRIARQHMKRARTEFFEKAPPGSLTQQQVSLSRYMAKQARRRQANAK